MGLFWLYIRPLLTLGRTSGSTRPGLGGGGGSSERTWMYDNLDLTGLVLFLEGSFGTTFRPLLTLDLKGRGSLMVTSGFDRCS